MLTLEERIARLEKQTHVVSLHADSAALSDIPDEVCARLAGLSTPALSTRQCAQYVGLLPPARVVL